MLAPFVLPRLLARSWPGLLLRVPSPSSPPKGLYNPKTFFTHAALLGQACAHCPIFPTAASRRSLGRVSVPVWLVVLSDQLPIAGLVGRYPANYLIGRRPLPWRLAALTPRSPMGPYAVLAPVSQGCPPPQGTFLRAPHPSAAEGRSPPRDLHVLSMPPAFALSQDQTLKFIARDRAGARPRRCLSTRLRSPLSMRSARSSPCQASA